MAVSLIVGKKYKCNTDKLGGYVKQNSTYNGKPLFNSSMALFTKGTIYTVNDKVDGYVNNSSKDAGTFYKMGGSYYTADWQFDCWDGPIA